MHVFVLIEVTSIFVISVCSSELPRLLALFSNRVVLVLASVVVMMIVVSMS